MAFLDIELPIIVAEGEPTEDTEFSRLDLNIETYRFLTIDAVGEVDIEGDIYSTIYSGGLSYLIGMPLDELNKKITESLNK